MLNKFWEVNLQMMRSDWTIVSGAIIRYLIHYFSQEENSLVVALWDCGGSLWLSLEVEAVG